MFADGLSVVLFGPVQYLAHHDEVHSLVLFAALFFGPDPFPLALAPFHFSNVCWRWRLKPCSQLLCGPSEVESISPHDKGENIPALCPARETTEMAFVHID